MGLNLVKAYHVCRTLSEGHGHRDDQDGSAKDTSSTDTSNRAADDESCRIRRNTADQGTNLEDKQGNEIDPFDRVVGVELSVDELGRAGGEEVRGSIPADIVEGFELICDSGNGSCDDCVIL